MVMVYTGKIIHCDCTVAGRIVLVLTGKSGFATCIVFGKSGKRHLIVLMIVGKMASDCIVTTSIFDNNLLFTAKNKDTVGYEVT